MTTMYHVKRGTKINGPFRIEELRNLFKTQKLKPDDRLALSPEGPWENLAAVLTEFSDGQPRLSSVPPPPLRDGTGGQGRAYAANSTDCSVEVG